MKAAVLRAQNQPMEIEEVAVSNPGPREVLVRTLAAGVCHSDLHFLDGSYLINFRPFWVMKAQASSRLSGET